MAVLAIFYGRGLKAQHYDALRKEVDWEHKLAPGGIFHAVGFDTQGDAHVADVWASQQELDAFVSQRLAPAFQKLKLPLPEVSTYPLHNATAYAAVDPYKV